MLISDKNYRHLTYIDKYIDTQLTSQSAGNTTNVQLLVFYSSVYISDLHRFWDTATDCQITAHSSHLNSGNPR